MQIEYDYINVRYITSGCMITRKVSQQYIYVHLGMLKQKYNHFKE